MFDRKHLRYGELRIEQGGQSSSTMRGACEIGAFSYIGSGGEITDTSIGRFCSIAKSVSIGATNHPTEWFSSHPFVYNAGVFRGAVDWEKISQPQRFKLDAAKTRIGNDVWIGVGATVKKGLTVGDGAIIGANSVVTKNVEPYSIVGGVPAKVIRSRFPEAVVRRMLALQWWQYDLRSDLLRGVDYSDAEGTLLAFERLVDAGTLEKWAPPVEIFTPAKPQANLPPKP